MQSPTHHLQLVRGRMWLRAWFWMEPVSGFEIWTSFGDQGVKTMMD